jgi:hypothetical protein
MLVRIDRMMTQIALSGLLKRTVAFAWGTCVDCNGSWDVMSAVSAHILPLRIPFLFNVNFGHHGDQFTLPVGLDAVLDADLGTISVLRAPTTDTPLPSTRNATQCACEQATVTDIAALDGVSSRDRLLIVFALILVAVALMICATLCR